MKKILHVCLANYYIDNYGYQENILPVEHKKLGYDVAILASTEIFVDNNQLGYTTARSYTTSEGIPITRIPYRKFLPHFIMIKLRLYKGVVNYLNIYKPDIIFMHDMQFLSILVFKKYLIKNKNVKLYVDCHADFYNSARNFLSKNILHRIIYKYCAKLIEPYAEIFWGVLPTRVDFLKQMYKISDNKVDLLLMGAEEEKVKKLYEVSINKIRKKYNIDEKSKIIISGGKVDSNKLQIFDLIEAYIRSDRENTKLLLFGSIEESLRDKFNGKLSNNVIYLGWLKSDQIYEVLYLADLVVFPGLHSVLWEQAVGLGKPCIFNKIDGVTHIDQNGNCKFIEEYSIENITKLLNETLENNVLDNMKIVAQKNMYKFSYTEIAKRSIYYGK